MCTSVWDIVQYSSNPDTNRGEDNAHISGVSLCISGVTVCAGNLSLGERKVSSLDRCFSFSLVSLERD